MVGAHCQKCGSGQKVRKIQNVEKLLCGECRARFPETLEEAREAYEVGRYHLNSKHSLPSFEVMYARLEKCARKEDSYQKIGRDYHLTRERIRKLHKKIFEKFIQKPQQKAAETAAS